MILGMVGGLQMLLLLGVLGGILIAVFFNITLQQSMAAVSQKNRSVAPGLIWLNFIPIPLLNSVWTMIFGIVTCNAMNKDAGHKIAPSTLAVVYPIILIVNIFLSLMFSGSTNGSDLETLAVFNLLLSGITFILCIVFWVELNSAKNKLQVLGIQSTYNDSLDSGSMNIDQTRQSYQSQQPFQPGTDDTAKTHEVNVNPLSSPNLTSVTPHLDKEPIITSHTPTNKPVERPQSAIEDKVTESISSNAVKSSKVLEPKRISEVELQRAYKQLDLAKGIDQIRVEEKYEQLSNELQSKINSTNTVKLKQIYSGRLNELEEAFATLLEHFGSSVS